MLSSRHTMTWTVAAMTVITAAAQAGAGIIYVDDDAPQGGDGLTWNTAYRFLQDALAVAGPSEVRVGQGLYKPDQDEGGNVTPGDREASFEVGSGVSLLGGFAGLGARNPDERDAAMFETVLSGDLLGDDEPAFVNNQENSHHVLTLDGPGPTVVLDGFVITGANAEGLEPFFGDSGGGLLASGATLVIGQCIFLGNSADYDGGAILTYHCNVNVTECTFENNRSLAAPGAGGAGGAIAFLDTDVMMTSCAIRSNCSSNLAGGIASAAFDGTAFNRFSDCVFEENITDLAGGGFLMQDVDVLMVGCTFRNNIATGVTSSGNGGGLRINSGNLKMVNSAMVSNAAGHDGGGVSARQVVSLINCTLTGNVAGSSGGGIDATQTNHATATNCVFWGNAPQEISEEATVSYTDVQGGFPGIGNIDADPLFVDPDNGDVRLQPGSPCIDAGHNWAIAGLTDTDLDGNPRFDGVLAEPSGCGLPAVVDMGAYEFQQGNTAEIKFGDIDGNAVVDGTDLMALLDAWGPCDLGCCLPDLDMDEMVGITDLLILLANWG